VQQPFGHVVASQEQAPVVVSHSPAAQVVQAAPWAPQSRADSEAYGTHVAPLQHPLGHDAGLHPHVPLLVLQYWPPAHAAQMAPPLPQDVLDCEPFGTHVLPLQQPFGHELVVQAHCPAALQV
jgi:hypothetical protein